MSLFSSLILSFFVLSTFSAVSIADPTDTANGNLISEPSLADYQNATRTPGFSQITDIVDENGTSR